MTVGGRGLATLLGRAHGLTRDAGAVSPAGGDSARKAIAAHSPMGGLPPPLPCFPPAAHSVALLALGAVQVATVRQALDGPNPC